MRTRVEKCHNRRSQRQLFWYRWPTTTSPSSMRWEATTPAEPALSFHYKASAKRVSWTARTTNNCVSTNLDIPWNSGRQKIDFAWKPHTPGLSGPAFRKPEFLPEKTVDRAETVRYLPAGTQWWTLTGDIARPDHRRRRAIDKSRSGQSGFHIHGP